MWSNFGLRFFTKLLHFIETEGLDYDWVLETARFFIFHFISILLWIFLVLLWLSGCKEPISCGYGPSIICPCLILFRTMGVCWSQYQLLQHEKGVKRWPGASRSLLTKITTIHTHRDDLGSPISWICMFRLEEHQEKTEASPVKTWKTRMDLNQESDWLVRMQTS